MKKLILLLVMLLLPMVAWAYDFEKDGIYYNITSIENKEVEVTYSKELNYQQSKVIIPSEVEWNGYAFKVKGIDHWTFCKANYPNKVDTLIISNGVEYIGSCAFQHANFKKLSIPNTINSIWNDTFINFEKHCCDWYVDDWDWLCSSGLFKAWTANNIYVNNVKLEEDLIIPDGVKFISCGNFAGLNWIKSLKISGSVEYIDASAFGECANLKTVELEEGVKELYGVQSKDQCSWYATGTFAKCYQLEIVNLPSTISVLGDGTFSDSPNLKEINCYINDPFPISSCFSNGQYLSAMLKIPFGTLSKYQTADGWKNFVNIVEALNLLDEPQTPKCATPTIKYIGGKLMFECETEGVEFVYSITTPANTTNQTGNNVDMPHTNIVSVYAKKEGYQNSDVATVNIDVRGIQGDTNRDGVVTVADAVGVVNIILEKNE